MEPESLIWMRNDPEWLIRLIVAERAPLGVLEPLRSDPEEEVRSAVEGRLG
jgi:hypothetical protein